MFTGSLPVKKVKKVKNFEGIQTERSIRRQIEQNLRKEVHANTKPSMDFIFKIVEDAYNAGVQYDISDLRPALFAFAAGSTNQADQCIKLLKQMHLKGKDGTYEVNVYQVDLGNPYSGPEDGIAFFDVEVFPNLFLVVWKERGADECHRMVNPTSSEVEELRKKRLVGFNCRRYDNHILYGRYLGYSNEKLYQLSRAIIEGGKRMKVAFGEAYDISYTDVYDFSSTKQSLKKFEIELGIHHQELGLPWDQPVPEDKWDLVAEYCENDVRATEAVFEARKGDWVARQILADMAGMNVNSTTNSLTERIIFGSDRNPQSQFNYRFMGAEEAEDCNYTRQVHLPRRGGRRGRLRLRRARHVPECRAARRRVDAPVVGHRGKAVRRLLHRAVQGTSGRPNRHQARRVRPRSNNAGRQARKAPGGSP